MSTPSRIYLDNAATSWPKPEAVYAAVEIFQRSVGAAAGRSPYAEAVEVTRAVEQARAACAKLLGIRNPAQLLFAANGTDALNQAIHGWLRPGDRVVTSAAEHNSVLRPLADWQARHQVELVRVPCDAHGRVDPDDVRRALATGARLVALTHASNVTGAMQPAAEIARLAHDAGSYLLLDAAQTAGHVPIDVEALDVDFLATSGHKGLLGPLGTGLLYIRPGVERSLRALRQGGTGTRSDEDVQPESLPAKYESGNLNVPGILGLGAGVEYLAAGGVQAFEQRLSEGTARLLAGLLEVPGVRVFGPAAATGRVGLVSITIEGYDPQEAAAVLDTAFRVQIRPGLHCAPRMHQALGTLNGGGTVRISLGHFTRSDDIDATVAALGEMAASA